VIYIVAVVLLGLIVVLAQLLLVYQKRAHDLRMKMEPIRRRIRDHRNTMAELFAKVQERGTTRLGELERYLAAQGEKLESAEAAYEDLESEPMLRVPEPTEEEEGEPAIGEDYDPEWEGQAAGAREVARAVLQAHESLDGQLNEMGRDREVIGRTLERMQSQFGEEVGGSKPRGRKRKAAP